MVSIQEHEKQISHFIAYVFAMLNYFPTHRICSQRRNNQSDVSRLSTIGICSLENDTLMLFPLEDIKDTMFFGMKKT